MGSGPSAIAHIEARTDRAAYLRDIATAMGVIICQMKRQDASGMAVVLMGSGASGIGKAARKKSGRCVIL